MVEYKRDATGAPYRIGRTNWRDLDGGTSCQGSNSEPQSWISFSIDSSSSLEEEKEYACPDEGCEERCSSLCTFLGQLDDHRKRNVPSQVFRQTPVLVVVPLVQVAIAPECEWSMSLSLPTSLVIAMGADSWVQACLWVGSVAKQWYFHVCCIENPRCSFAKDLLGLDLLLQRAHVDAEEECAHEHGQEREDPADEHWERVAE